MTEDFWNQFWPQFWGGVASTIFLAILTLIFTYVARLRIALFFKRTFETMKHKVAMEERKFENQDRNKE